MRRWIGLVLGIVSAGTAAWAAEDKVLNIYNWSDYIAEGTLKAFEVETGIKVNYDVYDSNETLDAKLRAGKSGYDLVAPTASPFLAQQLPAKLHRKLDKARIPNLKNLDPELMRQLAVYDPGNQFAVPWMWGTAGIGYNAAKIKQIMPDAPIDSLRMIFDPAIAARFKSCGIVLLDSATDVLPAALLYTGSKPDSHTPKDLDSALALMMKLRPNIRRFHSSEYINDLANGDACLTFGWSGDIIQAAKRASEAKNGVQVTYSIPKEGALVWIDAWVIPVDAPHPENAHAFINFVLRPEVTAANSNFIGYANGNLASLPLLDPEIRNNRAIYPDAETRKRFYTVSSGGRDYERLRSRTWTRITTGR